MSNFTKKLRNTKGRKASRGFVQLPKRVINSEEFSKLPARAVKLLIDLLSQYNGFNNGDLCLAWKIMEKKGWKSRDTLSLARKDLLETGFIVVTRQGGRNKATLYAITFMEIDDCKGKLDYGATKIPINGWKKTVSR